MDIVIDIGNTLAKAAVVDGLEVIESFTAQSLEELPLQEAAERYATRRSILSSTRGDSVQSAEYVRQKVGHCMVLEGSTPTPLRVEYSTATLGCDRLAAAVGAYVTYGGERELMVVDFGTAITIDFISKDGTFLGGFISPGVSTRFQSLHHFTASLPLCEPSCDVKGIAKCTKDAIIGGVINGITYEIEGYKREKMGENCEICVIFSGGDSIFFDKQIKNAIFAGRDLLFKGLATILEYNA